MHLGLDASYFVDQNVYDRESEQIFQSAWLYVGRADEIANRNQFRTYDIEGLSILVVRTETGPKAYHNVCRHRGAQLCQASQGTLRDGCLQCPYHAWTYDAHGALRSAPNMHGHTGFEPGKFGLAEIGCVVWQGAILINFSVEKSGFANRFAAIERQLEPWDMTNLQLGAERTYSVRANWKLLFQNFSECYHCPTVHPKLAQLTPYKSATNDLLEGPFLGGPMQLSDDAETMSIDGKFVGPQLPSIADELARQVGYYTVFPTMFISPHPDYVMVHRLRRIDPSTTLVACEFLFDATAIESGQVDAERAAEFWDSVNREDWHVCELVQRGAGAKVPPGPYGPLETVLPLFDQHYLAAMASSARVE